MTYHPPSTHARTPAQKSVGLSSLTCPTGQARKPGLQPASGHLTPDSEDLRRRRAGIQARRVWHATGRRRRPAPLPRMTRFPAWPAVRRSVFRSRPGSYAVFARSASLSINPSSGRMISASGNTATAQSAGRSIDAAIVTDSAGTSQAQKRLTLAEVIRHGSLGNDDRGDLGFLGDVPARPSGCGWPGSPRATGRPFVGLFRRTSRAGGPGGDANTLGQRLLARGARATGAKVPKPCQTCSVTNGMIGWSSRQSVSSSAASTRWAVGRATGSRSRPLTNSRYQSQNSPQVKSRSWRAASANRKCSRVGGGLADRAIEAVDNPAVLDGKLVEVRGAGRVAFEVHQGEPRGIPELVGEVSALLKPLGGVHVRRREA